jgi:hypothetical protein
MNRYFTQEVSSPEVAGGNESDYKQEQNCDFDFSGSHIYPLARQCEAPEHKIRGGEQAQARPEEIQLQGHLHIYDAKYREDGHCYNFLYDLQLCQRKVLKADAIGGDLEAILEKRDCPAYDNGDENRLALEVFQMPVPGVCHKQIRANQQHNRRHPSHKLLILNIRLSSSYRSHISSTNTAFVNQRLISKFTRYA